MKTKTRVALWLAMLFVRKDGGLVLFSTYRRFNAIVSQLKMHYFSGGAFESLISSQLLKKEKYI